MNGSAAFISMETASVDSLPNRVVEQAGGAQFRLPSNFTLSAAKNRSISIRVSEPISNGKRVLFIDQFFRIVHDAATGLDRQCNYKGE